MNKLCKKCDTVKPVEGFSNNLRAKDGLNSQCRACDAARKKAYRKDNPEKLAAYDKAYREANPEKVRASVKAWEKANPEKIAARGKAWRKANPEKARVNVKAWQEANPEKRAANTAKHRAGNPEKYTAYAAKRRAAKLQRTPPWLTQEHHDQILSKYEERGRLTQETGIEHHVDHIVPLQGDTVSGLHVPWNLQVITATENQQKSNSY